jgi:signal transduction histidine kinase
VRVRAELDETVVATADPRAVRQIVLNLLDNALKYGPAGQLVTVGVRRSGDDDRALLWVDDEGPGVAGADRARVWEPFERAPLRDGNGGGAPGSGIGLAVVRELAGLMDGRAWVEDAPTSGGARFVVELPMSGVGYRVSGVGTSARDVPGPFTTPDTRHPTPGFPQPS